MSAITILYVNLYKLSQILWVHYPSRSYRDGLAGCVGIVVCVSGGKGSGTDLWTARQCQRVFPWGHKGRSWNNFGIPGNLLMTFLAYYKLHNDTLTAAVTFWY